MACPEKTIRYGNGTSAHNLLSWADYFPRLKHRKLIKIFMIDPGV